MRRRLPPSTLDYLVAAIAPTLIIIMVVSMMWYLASVLGVGVWHTNYILFFFAIAAVLITRIAIELGSSLASLYALGLAVAMMLVLARFAPAALLPGGLLLGLSWWAVDRLVWDSTVLDESQRARTTGLLQTIGLDRPRSRGSSSAAGSDPTKDETERAATRGGALVAGPSSGTTDTATPHATTSRADADAAGWWQRLLSHQRRMHVPGRWSLYFLFSALPIFGLTQALASRRDAGDDQYRFVLVLVYLASNLALLMSTSLLQLRRYLRHRQVAMPNSMATSWLVGGAIVIGATLLVCLVLPRPRAEFSAVRMADRWLGADNPKLKPSRWSLTNQGLRDDRVPASGTSELPGSEQRQDVPGDGREDGQKADPGGINQPGEQSGNQSRDQQGNQPGSQQSGSGEPNAQKSSEPNAEQGRGAGQQSSSRQASSGGTESRSAPPSSSRSPSSSSRSPSSSPSTLPSLPQLPLGGLVRVIYWLALLAAAAWIAWRLRDVLGEWWRRARTRPGDDAEADAAEALVPTRTFADFADPFGADGSTSMDAAELVQYTFEAVEAWAHDHGRARLRRQTPSEFTRSVVGPRHPLHRTLTELGDYYNELAYGSRRVPVSAVATARGIWLALRGSS